METEWHHIVIIIEPGDYDVELRDFNKFVANLGTFDNWHDARTFARNECQKRNFVVFTTERVREHKVVTN